MIEPTPNRSFAVWSQLSTVALDTGLATRPEKPGLFPFTRCLSITHWNVAIFLWTGSIGTSAGEPQPGAGYRTPISLLILILVGATSRTATRKLAYAWQPQSMTVWAITARAARPAKGYGLSIDLILNMDSKMMLH
jgi:hypothetical protein